MDIWKEMYLKAKEEYHPEDVSPFIKVVLLKDIVPNWWGDKRYVNG